MEISREVAWLPRTLAQIDLEQNNLVLAGTGEDEIAIEIRLFRPIHSQNQAAESFWAKLGLSERT
jgi:LysR family transcriptional regulator, hypochlorite-specific transcription factor HypT